MLRKHKIYVAPNQSFKLHKMLEESKFEDLKTISQTGQSNLSLEIFCTDDQEYALLQALEFIPYNDVPTSPVMVCKGVQAKQLSGLF